VAESGLPALGDLMRLNRIKCMFKMPCKKIRKKLDDIPLQTKKGAYHFNQNKAETFQSFKNIELS
jgi:hypothetical protein